MLMGCLALSVDAGRILLAQRQMQAFADAAAMAGALEITTCGTTTNCTAMQNAAKSAAQEVGASSVTIVTQCASSSGDTGLVVQLNNGPCALGTADPNHGSASYVEAVVGEQVNTIFGNALGQGSFNVKARAEAGGGSPEYCVYLLSPSASDALLVNGNATLSASCGIQVDSGATPAAIFNGGDTITSKVLDIVGTDINNGNNTISPSPTTGASSQPDPLSSLATPTVGSCGSGSGTTWNGSASTAIPSSSPATFNQGVYCGGIILNGSINATFNPGTYIIEGNMILNGSDTITGSGVTFYFTSGSLTMNGNSHAVLSAPTTGTYAGILYFQSRTDSSSIIFNGDSTSGWQGTIYAADASLTINGGNSSAAYTNLVVNTLTENGNDDFTIGDDYSSLPGGDPIKSGSTVAMVE
jgi:hypothetical protein